MENCLDPAMLNQVLIRPIYRVPPLSDILPKVNNTKYLSLIAMSSSYQNLKVDKGSTYLTTFAC